MTKNMKLAGLCFLLLVSFTFLTNPSELPTPLLILPFLLIFFTLLLVMQALFNGKRQNTRKKFRLTLFIAILPVVLLAMQSIGQLTTRDIVTLLALFLVAYLYMYRAARSQV